MESTNLQSRKWLLTVNNPLDYGLNMLKSRTFCICLILIIFALWMRLQQQVQGTRTFSFTQSHQFAFQH